MRPTNRLAGAVLALAAAAIVVVVPLANVAAVADTPPPGVHWGQSPYYPECLEGPCRVVIVADKTGDAQFGLQIQRWIFWMNYVRNTYNQRLPAFGYVALDDPSCATAPGVISVCRDDAIVAEVCPGSPDAIHCSEFSINVGPGHIIHARTAFKTISVDAADTWTLVCAGLGRSVGLSASDDESSCLHDPILLGTGQEKYYTGPDWITLWQLYDHPAGS